MTYCQVKTACPECVEQNCPNITNPGCTRLCGCACHQKELLEVDKTYEMVFNGTNFVVTREIPMKKFRISGYAKYETRLNDVVVEAENEAEAINIAFDEGDLDEHFRHVENIHEVKE